MNTTTPIKDGGPAFACDAGDGNGQRGIAVRAAETTDRGLTFIGDYANRQLLKIIAAWPEELLNS